MTWLVGLFLRVSGWAKAGFAFLRTLDPRTLLLIGAGLVVILFYAELRHTRKTLAGEQAWGKTVLASVSKGVGKPVPKDHAAAQIDAAFANAKTLSDALDRQNAALKQSATDAAARNAAAKAAVEPTSEQKVRETTRKALVDPKRATGLSDKEWGQL